MRPSLALALVLALAACAPRLAEGRVLLVPGGVVQGAWVEPWGIPLPGPPLLADGRKDLLYFAYPFELLVYEDAMPKASIPLPGTPRFLHARPLAAAGGPFGLWSERGTLDHPARDARATPKGLFWLDEQGRPYHDRRPLGEERYQAVVAHGERVAFLGREAWFLDLGRFAIVPFKKAELFTYLYLLTPRGVAAYTPSGLELAFLPGSFQDLKVDEAGVWLLGEGGELVATDHELEVRR